jgi:hypothetical protein
VLATGLVRRREARDAEEGKKTMGSQNNLPREGQKFEADKKLARQRRDNVYREKAAE